MEFTEFKLGRAVEAVRASILDVEALLLPPSVEPGRVILVVQDLNYKDDGRECFVAMVKRGGRPEERAYSTHRIQFVPDGPPCVYGGAYDMDYQNALDDVLARTSNGELRLDVQRISS